MDRPGQHRAERIMMTGELEKKIMESRGMCICEPCPTYNECMRADESLLFCVTGKSATCTFEKKGCICPTCPVTKYLGLKKAYYCIKGNEQEQH
ncbi:MAG: DUF2769 domain-containing protein [Methanoregula sp.]|jgi:hypothetical protein